MLKKVRSVSIKSRYKLGVCAYAFACVIVRCSCPGVCVRARPVCVLLLVRRACSPSTLGEAACCPVLSPPQRQQHVVAGLCTGLLSKTE